MLFKDLLTLTEEQIEKAGFTRRSRSLKRWLEAAYDDASAKIDDINGKLEKLYLDFAKGKASKVDVNDVIQLRSDERRLQEAQEILAVEYATLFGKPLPATKQQDETPIG